MWFTVAHQEDGTLQLPRYTIFCPPWHVVEAETVQANDFVVQVVAVVPCDTHSELLWGLARIVQHKWDGTPQIVTEKRECVSSVLGRLACSRAENEYASQWSPWAGWPNVFLLQRIDDVPLKMREQKSVTSSHIAPEAALLDPQRNVNLVCSVACLHTSQCQEDSMAKKRDKTRIQVRRGMSSLQALNLCRVFYANPGKGARRLPRGNASSCFCSHQTWGRAALLGAVNVSLLCTSILRHWQEPFLFSIRQVSQFPCCCCVLREEPRRLAHGLPLQSSFSRHF